jgi:hypothetical protein
MRRLNYWKLAGLVHLMVLAAITMSCSGSKPTEQAKPESGDPPPKPAAKKEFPATGRGTLMGQVTLKGDMPALQDLTQTEDYKKKPDCHKEKELKEETWVVNAANKGVANVVVWLVPAGDYYFKMDPEKDLKEMDEMGKGGTWAKEKSIDQPICTYIPHVQVLFPAYYTPEGEKKTGQKFSIMNSATFDHNTTWKGGSRNPGANPLLKTGEKKEITVHPDGGQPINFSCQIHPWMKGYAWAFNHPYAAVTDEKGNFTIKNAPAGADVRVMYWHESMTKPAELKTIKIEPDKEVTENFQVGK